jgi:hypothetical protein
MQCTGSLLPLFNIKGDTLSLSQHLERCALDSRSMEEDLAAIIGRDEPKPTLLHQTLNFSRGHDVALSLTRVTVCRSSPTSTAIQALQIPYLTRSRWKRHPNLLHSLTAFPTTALQPSSRVESTARHESWQVTSFTPGISCLPATSNALVMASGGKIACIPQLPQLAPAIIILQRGGMHESLAFSM